MCSEHCEDYNISFVSIDDIAAAQKATQYLISTGRRKIAMMNSSTQFKYARHREKGFRLALEEAQIIPNEDWILHLSTMSYGLAMANAMHILSQPDRPDAIFAASDVYAIGVIKAAHKLGLNVPDDLAVVGFDNIEISTMTEPSITTIKQPSRQIGFQSCELLVEQIVNPNADPRQITLETELIVRDSTPLNYN